MFYVVRIDEARVVTAWKHTTLVSCVKRSFDCRGYGACLAADAERIAILIFNDDNGIAVTTQAFYGLEWQARTAIAVFECRLSHLTI